MSATLTMDGRQSVPPSLTLGYAPWTRGTLSQSNTKSSGRLLCPPERRHEFQGWDTACAAHSASAES